MKRIAFVLMLCIIVLVSCNQEPSVPQATGYETPTITGTVSIPESSGFKSEDVWVKVRETGNIVKAAQDGKFVISNLDEKTAYTLEFSTATPSNTSPRVVDARNYATSISNVKALTGKGNDIGYVILRPTGNVNGKVMLYNADSSEGIVVTAAGTSYSVQTAADGSFFLNNLPEGTYTLSFSKAGYISRDSDSFTIIAPNDTQSPVISLNDIYLFSSDNTARIEGTASYSDKTDVSGITLSLSDSTGTVISQLVTSPSGIFSFSNIPAGAYAITASAPEYDSVKKEITVAERQVYTLTVEPLRSIYGSLSGSIGLEGLTDLSGVTVRAISENHSYNTLSSADGSFSFSSMVHGTYSITFEKEGYLPYTIDKVIVSSMSELQLDKVSLKSAYGSVMVTVRFEDRTQHDGITVSLIDSTGSVIESKLTSKDGTATFNSVRYGSGYSLTAEAEDYISVTKTGISVISDATTTVQMKSLVFLYGSVSGTVLDNSSNGIANVAVKFASTSDPAVSFNAVTGEDGSYSIDRVAAGTYSLSFTHEEYISQSRTGISISSGKHTTVEKVSLTSVYGAIAVKARLDAGTDFSGITVSLFDNQGSFIENKTTTAGGDVLFTKVHFGSGYRISLEKEDYYPGEKNSIVVVSETTTEVSPDALVYKYGTIEGKVIDNTGKSLSGAIVAVVSNSDSDISYSLTSDDTGTFSNDRILEGKYTATVMAHNYGTVTLKNTFTIKSRQVTNAGTTKLIPIYGTVQGSVGYADKENPKDISVIITDKDGKAVLSVITTETGLFSISEIYPGTYTVTASASGYSSQTREVVVTAGTTNDVVLEDLETVFGIIDVSASLAGSDVRSGITVNLYKATEFVENGVTNENGKVTFNKLVKGSDYSISVIYDGYASVDVTSISVVSNKSTNVTVSALSSKFGTVSGTVTDNASEGLSGALVLLTNVADGTRTYTISTGTDGSFSRGNIETGVYSVTVSLQGYGTVSLEQSITISSGLETSVGTVKLTPTTGKIIGTVTYSDKSDHSGITVTLKNTSGTAVDSIVTTESGAFEFTDVAPGSYTVVPSATGYGGTDGSVTVKAGNTYEVNLEALSSVYGTVSGTVTDNASEGLSGVLVLLTNKTDGTKTYTISTGTDGTFSRGNIETGIYSVTVSLQGYGTVNLEQSITISSGLETNVGTVKLTSTTAVVNGTVLLSGSSDSSGIAIVLRNDNNHYNSSTATDGTFSIMGVAPGTYEVSYSKTNFTSYTGSLTVVAGETVTLGSQTLISNLGAITGKVVVEGRSNYSGVTVTARSVSFPDAQFSSTTSEDGTYYIGNLETAIYTVSFGLDGFYVDSDSITSVTAGSASTISTVTLESAAATLAGSVTLSGSADHTGIQVLLRNNDASHSYNTSTDKNGEYTLSQVLPDVYTLYLSKSGYETKTITGITMTQSTDKLLDSVELAVAVRSITGAVTLELASDYSGALVTATNMSDATLIYSAITNSSGNYALAGMVPGEYQIVISKANYNSLTLPTVSIIDDSKKDLGTSEVSIARGTISGIARLQGYSDYSGITVTLNGTDYTTQTDETGFYELSVPSGNYSGGLLFEREDFQTESHTEVVSVLTNGTYGITTHTLTCLNVAEVKGTFELRHADDSSGIVVTLSNAEHTFTMTTQADGKWSFAHVPVGTYTLSTVMVHTPDFSMNVNILPAPVYDAGTLVLIPNSSNVSGFVNLDGLSSHGGITVTAVPDDTEEITRTTITAADGSYTLSNLVSYVDYTITFSKTGWNSDSTTVVSNLQPLEERVLETIVTLTDTTAPVLNSIVINNGANVSDDNHVVLHFNTSEYGSGIAKVMVTYDNVFDRTVTRHDYLANMDWTLPSGNGTKTIYVKVVDLSGNESNTVSASIMLTDQKKEVSGVLTGEDLHWTEGNSPYLVTGNILVETDKTLIIDPGVDVQFAGAYYIQVEGLIEAIGTEQKKISFYGIDAGENTWQGIKCAHRLVISGEDGNHAYSSGSILSHVNVQNCSTGIIGSAYVENSSIVAFGYALGGEKSQYFTGMVKDSTVIGNISSYYASFYGNTINSTKIEDNRSYQSYFDGNFISGSYIEYIHGTGNEFSVDFVITRGTISNSIFHGGYIGTEGSGDFYYATFDGCSIYLDVATVVMNCSFNGCRFDGFYASRMNFSNMINCNVLSIGTGRSSLAECDMKYNFWGYDKAREMNESGDKANLSFITDYYDDFNRTKVVYSDWVQEPFSFVGYKGDSYSTYTITPQTSGSPTISIDANHDITVLGANKIAVATTKGNEPVQFRVFQSADEVAGTDTDDDLWMDLNAGFAEFVYDPDKYVSWTDWNIQFKDSLGNISGVSPVSIPIGNLHIVGPAGGFVFFDKGKTSDGWRFLEAAPADLRVINGVPTIDSNVEGYSSASTGYEFGFYRTEDNGSNLYVNGDTTFKSSNCTGTTIGTGKNNTQLLVAAMGEQAYSLESGPDKTGDYAARLCDIFEYSVNEVVYDDWFLPSADELNLIYENLMSAGIGDFSGKHHWSSSEQTTNANGALYFDDVVAGSVTISSRRSYHCVRAVRAF